MSKLNVSVETGQVQLQGLDKQGGGQSRLRGRRRMSWLYRILAIGVLIGLLTLGYRAWSVHHQGIGEARATASYNAAIDRQKAQFGQLLATETKNSAAATKALHDSKAQREIDDAKNASTVAALAGRLHAANVAGRLRDPNASPAGCGDGGGGAPAADPTRAGGGRADTGEASGLLSADLTELLLSQAQAADDINVAYTSCRLDAINLREVLK